MKKYGRLRKRKEIESNLVMYEAKEKQESQMEEECVEREEKDEEYYNQILSQYNSFMEYCDRENRHSEIRALQQYQYSYQTKDWGKSYLRFCETKNNTFRFIDLLDEWHKYETAANYKEAIKAECAYLFCFMCHNMIESGKNTEDAICEAWEGVLYHLLIVHQWMIIWMEYSENGVKVDEKMLHSLKNKAEDVQNVLKDRDNDIQHEMSIFERITGVEDKEIGSLSACEANALSAIMEVVIEEENQTNKKSKSKNGFYFAASEINNKKNLFDDCNILYEIQKKEYYGSMYSKKLYEKMQEYNKENDVDSIIALDRYRGNYSVGAIVYSMHKIGLIEKDASLEMRERVKLLANGLMELWEQGEEIKELSGFLVGYMLLLIDKVLDEYKEDSYENVCRMLLQGGEKKQNEKKWIKNQMYNGLCNAIGKINVEGFYIGLTSIENSTERDKSTFDDLYQESQKNVFGKSLLCSKEEDLYRRFMILYEIYRWE